MPEGHTVHRIALDHAKLLVGQHVAVSSPQGRFNGSVRVDGQRLDWIEAYGKHLFYGWANKLVGHVHLGLFGHFRVTRHERGETPEPKGLVRMRLATDQVTIDLSGPTDCSVGDEDDHASIVARLGPDPLRRDAQPQRAFDRIMKSKQSIGALLLNQSVICGIGNVYRAEVLFVAGIHPSRVGSSFDQGGLEALWSTTKALLRKGVKDNAIITVDHNLRDLAKGRHTRHGRCDEATWVYKGDRCLRCGTPIAAVELGGRPCYFCPTCQPR